MIHKPAGRLQERASRSLNYPVKMAIEIVDLPIKNSYFPLLCKRLTEGTPFIPMKSLSHLSHLVYCSSASLHLENKETNCLNMPPQNDQVEGQNV